jgi:hypothetical protein
MRYFNWHRAVEMPRGWPLRHPKAGVIYRWRVPGHAEEVQALGGGNARTIIYLPEKPIILGPFTVKIEPWPTQEQSDSADKVIKMWNHIEEAPTSDMQLAPIVPHSQTVDELLKVFPPVKDAPCSIGAMLKLYSWLSFYPFSLDNRDITDIPTDKDLAEPPPDEKQAKRLEKMLTELRTMKADEKPGVLRDLMCYWEVRTLLDMGLRAEALKAARENPTPDIMMLIGVRIGLKYNDKWREDGAPYAIPADDYTDPEPEPVEEEPQPPAPLPPQPPAREDHSWP